MLEALSTSRNRTRFVVFLTICGLLVVAALLVGINDNPPGIALAFAAAAAFILAFVHPWRTVKRFGLFLLASILGFLVCAVLHNIFHGVADMLTDLPVLQITLQILAVVTFLIAVLVAPPAVLVGVLGIIVMAIRNRRGPERLAGSMPLLIPMVIVLCGAFTQAATAQPYYARGSYYAGSGSTWDYDAGNQLYDDGLHGDGAAGDGIFAATVVSDQPAGLHQFKIANEDWSELWPHNPGYPLENARLVTATAGEAIFFRLDTNARPGWVPESNAVMTDHALPAGTTLELMGSAPELGSWTTPLAASEDGGVWTVEVTLAEVGSIEYKFRSVGSWDWAFGRHYNMLIGENFTFENTQADNAVVISFDTNDGRAAVESATPVRNTTWGRLKMVWQ